MQPEITLYRPEFKDQILELATDLWNPDPALNSAYLAWKYESNPHVKDPLLYLALERGKVIGMRGAYGTAWVRDDTGEQLPALGMGDLVIAPDHRGRGLFGAIMRSALPDLRRRGYRFVVNLSASPATYLQSVRSGWRDLGSVATMFKDSGRRRFIRRAHALRQRLPALAMLRPTLRHLIWRTIEAPAARVGHAFIHLDQSGLSIREQPSLRVSLETQPRPEAMADLIARLGTAERLRQRRDATHIRWRYRNPLSQYRFLFLERTSRLQGYLVLQASISAHNAVASIVDWEGFDIGVLEALLKHALRRGRFELTNTWSATLPAERVSLLTLHGFLKIGEQPSRRHREALLIRSLHDSTAQNEWNFANLNIASLENWELRMIDSDSL